MKFKIVREKSPIGDYYYSVYEKYWFFFWFYQKGFFDTLKEAEEYVVRTLKEEKEHREKEKETPVYYKLEDGVIYSSKNDGREPPLKLKKTETIFYD